MCSKSWMYPSSAGEHLQGVPETEVAEQGDGQSDEQKRVKASTTRAKEVNEAKTVLQQTRRESL